MADLTEYAYVCDCIVEKGDIFPKNMEEKVDDSFLGLKPVYVLRKTLTDDPKKISYFKIFKNIRPGFSEKGESRLIDRQTLARREHSLSRRKKERASKVDFSLARVCQ